VKPFPSSRIGVRRSGASLNRSSRRQEALTSHPQRKVSLLTSAATRFKERVAKPGIRNPAARRIRAIAPAGNDGADDENRRDKERSSQELTFSRSHHRVVDIALRYYCGQINLVAWSPI
jgi:hypothetical protein